MPVFHLSDDIFFPNPDLAEEDGLLAVGGDLSEQRILHAYRQGIFPWYSEGMPILWWSPDPRLVLLPGELRVSRSLRRTIRKGIYTITFDKAFEDVIRMCAMAKRKSEESTWIVEDMRNAYVRLHRSGYAHSVEAWTGGRLVGGLYGVSLGRAFFGESMFSLEPDASKVALAAIVRRLREWAFKVIDCQVTTSHLISLGAREIPRRDFLTLLGSALEGPTMRGKWGPDPSV